MESNSLSKKTYIVEHKNEQNYQYINKTQYPNRSDEKPIIDLTMSIQV